MQKNNRAYYYIQLITCIALVAVCFMPWVHYNSINTTFTGYHVTKFATGVYYGKPGMVITVFAAVIFLLTLLRKNLANRINLFVAALLLAYTIRTYILFTGSLFDGEVERLAGIFLIVLFSAILLIVSAFPRSTD